MLAAASNGTVSYLATSYQGSVVEALDSTGAVGVTASQLYAPYGGVRYSSGTMPTDYGYTGQRSDASTGLDYYGARYYDPTLGQFTSADTVLAGGLNRYGYVSGNPTTATDPSGHMDDENPDEGAATGTQGAPPGSFAAGVGGGGGLAAFFAWLFGEDEAASGAAAGSAVAGAGAATTDDPLVLDEGSNTTATIDDGGITFTNTQTGDSDFKPNSYFNDVQDPATENPGSHYWRALDQEANELDPPQTTSTEGPSDNPSNPGKPDNGPTQAPSNPSQESGTGNAGNIDGMYGSGASTNGGNVTVYRAVDNTEFQAMEDQFQFGPSGTKFFTNTQASAENFGHALAQWDPPVRIMRGEVPVERLLQSDVTTGSIRGTQGMIWEIGFYGNPGDPLDFILNVTDLGVLP